MVRGTSDGRDDPFQTNNLLVYKYSDPEQSFVSEKLITSQDGSWEIQLKSQGRDGKGTPSGNFLT
jgi:hypothetical protein